MRDAEAKLVFVFLQHFGEKSRLARPTGAAENKGRWARAAGHHPLDKESWAWKHNIDGPGIYST